MLDQTTLERLTDAIARRGGAVPALKCQQFYAILTELFTSAEAELAIKLPLEAMTARQLSQLACAAGIGNLTEMLESMANKGILLAGAPGENTTYKLLPLLPGIMEFQFLKGGTDERDRKIILVIHEYLKFINKAVAAAPAPGTDPSERRRTISLDKLVAQIGVVYSYAEVMDYITRTDDIAVGACTCRHRGEVVGRPCDKPKDVCMIFGSEARAAAARGMVRLLSKDEARKVLDRAEEAGLVHTAMYQQGGFIDFLCNCCTCHCSTLRGIKHAPVPCEAAIVKHVVEIDRDSCMGCADCVPRCQMGALSMSGDDLQLDAPRCIGCGLCMYICPSGALKLVKRSGLWVQ